MMKPNIVFTPNALAYVKAQLTHQKEKSFRLSIKKTGCSGFSYHPELINESKANDIEMQLDEMTIYIDPVWLHVLDGVQIDYVEENKSGLKQKRLTFSNPHEVSRCGCGESFHLE